MEGKREAVAAMWERTQKQGRKPFQELDLSDDFMFHVAAENLECCKLILELLLGVRIKKIRWKEGEKAIRNLPDKRGIRLDFYVEIEDGEIPIYIYKPM